MTKGVRIGINLLVLGLVIGFLYYIVSTMGSREEHYAQPLEEELLMANALVTQGGSSYQKRATITLPTDINRMEWSKGILYVVADEILYLYKPSTATEVSTNAEGYELISQFQLKPGVRDLAIANNGEIYILYATLIEVYSSAGELNRSWEACSELSDYCSLAISSEGGIYVTDAANKNICQYSDEGNFVRFINSPNGFIIPSYAFDLVCHNDTLYAVNSGKHLIESYTLKGEYITAFGKSGAAAGEFAGCCNPTYISINEQGELITSEKGVNRLTQFTNEGALKEVVFKGSSRTPSEVVFTDKMLCIAQKKQVVVYERKE